MTDLDKFFTTDAFNPKIKNTNYLSEDRDLISSFDSGYVNLLRVPGGYIKVGINKNINRINKRNSKTQKYSQFIDI